MFFLYTLFFYTFSVLCFIYLGYNAVFSKNILCFIYLSYSAVFSKNLFYLYTLVIVPCFL